MNTKLVTSMFTEGFTVDELLKLGKIRAKNRVLPVEQFETELERNRLLYIRYLYESGRIQTSAYSLEGND